MPAREIEVVVAVDGDAARSRLEKTLKGMGLVPAIVGTSIEVYRLSPQQWMNALVILDTNDDVARLVQLINDLHRSPYHPGGGLPVICVVSSDTLQRNQSLGAWVIDGLAAVLAVWTRDGRDFEVLPGLIRRISEAPRAEPAAVRPGYEEYLRRIFADPNSAEAILELATRLMEWQSLTQSRTELIIALIRQAIHIDPDSAEAHARLAQALIWHGEMEAAISEGREAVRLKPDLAEAHYHLGSALFANRQRREARAEMKAAIALDHEGSVARWARNTLSSL
jgi:tetratricopeptide (TPR) repeat protein